MFWTICAGLTLAGAIASASPVLAASTNPTNPPASAFKGGERLEYELRYLFAKGAEAWLTTTDTVVEGLPLYHHTIGGRTTGILDMAYPVFDEYHSYTNRGTGLPLVAIRDVHEQSYKDYKKDTFHRGVGEDKTTIVREDGSEVDAPNGTLDIVSLVYYLRNRINSDSLRKDQLIVLPVFFNAEMMKMRIRYKGNKRVKTEFGRMECMHFVPAVNKGDLFEDEDSMDIWLSADRNHVPMRIRVGLFIGSLKCNLVKAEGLKYPLGEEE